MGDSRQKDVLPKGVLMFVSKRLHLYPLYRNNRNQQPATRQPETHNPQPATHTLLHICPSRELIISIPKIE